MIDQIDHHGEPDHQWKPATQFLRKLGYISSTDFEVSLCVFSISFGNLPLEGQIGEEDRVGLPLGAINATR